MASVVEGRKIIDAYRALHRTFSEKYVTDREIKPTLAKDELEQAHSDNWAAAAADIIALGFKSVDDFFTLSKETKDGWR
jgi:hypothetical protein